MEKLTRMLKTGVAAVWASLWMLGIPAMSWSASVGDRYPADQYWIGRGQGDLTKGGVVCRRVAELAARADLARQIRVLIKEHLTDRVHERSGREPEQDIELIREEIVEEYLRGVEIVDVRVDEGSQACFVTAVMSKNQTSGSTPSSTPR
ncbi:MAG: LPP20 family lipoprotein [Nitrospira sp.]|nr:LPP20 family lipoprotein [Nitrospira sp.]